MTYTEQIEQYVAFYPQTVLVHVPTTCRVDSLPAFPAVSVVSWDENFCELEDAGSIEIARFRLVG